MKHLSRSQPPSNYRRESFWQKAPRLSSSGRPQNGTISSGWSYSQTEAMLQRLSSGRAIIGSSYLRLAAESLLSKYTSEQSSESEEIAVWGILTLHRYVSGSINPCCWKPTPAECSQVYPTKSPQSLSRLIQYPLVILILSKDIISGATISSWVTLMSSSDLATPC